MRAADQPLELEATASRQPELVKVPAQPDYEYSVLVTNTELEMLSLARLYRERGDSENTIDELKRQWGWGGFVTKDLLRCQVAARNVALIYNWWSLFVRCADPTCPREAVTSRPLLMYAVGREVSHAGQTTLVLTRPSWCCPHIGCVTGSFAPTGSKEIPTNGWDPEPRPGLTAPDGGNRGIRQRGLAGT